MQILVCQGGIADPETQFHLWFDCALQLMSPLTAD